MSVMLMRRMVMGMIAALTALVVVGVTCMIMRMGMFGMIMSFACMSNLDMEMRLVATYLKQQRSLSLGNGYKTEIEYSGFAWNGSGCLHRLTDLERCLHFGSPGRLEVVQISNKKGYTRLGTGLKALMLHKEFINPGICSIIMKMYMFMFSLNFVIVPTTTQSNQDDCKEKCIFHICILTY